MEKSKVSMSRSTSRLIKWSGPLFIRAAFISRHNTFNRRPLKRVWTDAMVAKTITWTPSPRGCFNWSLWLVLYLMIGFDGRLYDLLVWFDCWTACEWLTVLIRLIFRRILLLCFINKSMTFLTLQIFFKLVDCECLLTVLVDSEIKLQTNK